MRDRLYQLLSQEDIDGAMERLIGEAPKGFLVSIPGVRELVAEELHNDSLEACEDTPLPDHGGLTLNDLDYLLDEWESWVVEEPPEIRTLMVPVSLGPVAVDRSGNVVFRTRELTDLANILGAP